MSITKVAENKCFGGLQQRYKHQSSTVNCTMHFSIYLPEAVVVDGKAAPVLYWLSGLTCTDLNFVQKAGAQRVANDLGIIIVAPDTSPRGEQVPDDPDGAYDLGLGAGFYVNATQEPWSTHYNMYDYVLHELHELVDANFATTGKQSIAGHSMGGHGALVLGLRNQDIYSSISAFSPICNPSVCPWGEKAFANYLGADKTAWQQYDATKLLAINELTIPVRIDQGADDEFLLQQLMPQNLLTESDGLEYYLHDGYDHSYFFISSYIATQCRFHSVYLS